MKQSSFRELTVWKKAIDVSVEIYTQTRKFPPEERYALASQMQRAVVSIASNIAEGSGRGSKKEFSQFLSIAIGSASELETQLELTSRLSYVTQSDVNTLLERVIEIKRMLVGLRSSLVR